MDEMETMKLHDADEFRDLVAMHLSFLVHVPLHSHVQRESGVEADAGFSSSDTAAAEGKGVMDGARLTEEGTCQVRLSNHDPVSSTNISDDELSL